MNLSSKRGCMYLAILTLIILSKDINAQRGNYNFLNFEQKPYYFGIAIGVNQSNLQIHRSSKIILNENINKVESVNSPGLNLGIISNLKIQKYFDLRFTPSLVMGGKNLSYDSANPEIPSFKQTLETVTIDLPFHVRYKSAPYHDKRLFVIAGMKYSFDLANDANSINAEEIVKLSPTDFAFEVGAGIQFFLPYFIFSPEIKFSQGIGNIHIHDSGLGESTVLEKVLSRAFTISLNFEG